MSDWIPMERQKEALMSEADETLFGGARGGGKTDTGMAWMLYDIDNPDYLGLVLRKNQTDLKEWTDRAIKFYKRNGAEYKNGIFLFPSGAKIFRGHLKDSNAYMKYQGGEYHRMLIEELSQIPSEEHYLSLVSSNRSTVDGLKARVFATTNPDYPGLDWIRGRWNIPQQPDFSKTYTHTSETGRTFCFVPSKIEDNKFLAEDKSYLATLEEWKKVDPARYQAWRHGNWGGYKRQGVVYNKFDKQRHVVMEQPFKTDVKIVGLDWGYTHPMSVLEICVNNEMAKPRFYIKSEWYKVGRQNEEAIDHAVILGASEYYPDIARADACEALRNRGVIVKDVSKAVSDGINAVQLAFAENRLFVDASCSNVVNELFNYVWKEGRTDEVVKDMDHAMDALRYAIFNYNANINDIYSFPNAPVIKTAYR